MPAKKLSVFLVSCFMVLFAAQTAMADRVYTLTEDFLDGGNAQLVDVDPGNNQLQLSITETPFAFVNIAATGSGTIVRIDAESGDIIGEYRTAPEGLSATPSRTSVDSQGNVWAGNQGDLFRVGDSVVKIGIVIGGTAYAKINNPQTGEPEYIEDESGEYLLGPFLYNTCVDRPAAGELEPDGYIRTSRGLSNVLPWPNINDGGLNDAGIVQDAEDECILIYKRLPDAPNPQHVSVDADNDVWVGGYQGAPGFSGNPTKFFKLAGDTGAVLESFDASIATGFGCGGFGGLVDDNGILWSASQSQNKLLHYNPADGSGGCIDVLWSYGLAESVIEQEVGSDVFIWNSSKWLPNQITKIDASTFQVEPGFPKSTAISGDSGFEDRGVAVTPVDNNVWVVKAGAQQLRRMDSAGNLLNNGIALVDPVSGESALDPTGIAVDANGKLWVANRGTNNVMRIDPAAGADGLGAVDLTVNLRLGDSPDNYSDMAGVVPITEASPQGTWTVINDGGNAGTIWDVITWNTEPEGSEPEGTLITVEAQAADAESDLDDDNNFVMVSNGGPLSLTGRFIKIRATLTADESGTSPVLSDLEVKSIQASKICDVNQDGNVDSEDIMAIFMATGQEPSGPDDPRDFNGDGLITVGDARGCVLNCTNPRCAPVD